MNFDCGKGSDRHCCTREERNGIVWQLAGAWKWRGMDNGRCRLCSGKEDVEYAHCTGFREKGSAERNS